MAVLKLFTKNMTFWIVWKLEIESLLPSNFCFELTTLILIEKSCLINKCDAFLCKRHIAVATELNKNLLPVLDSLLLSLREKSKEFETLIKIGRTHFQDAVPLTLGQEFSAFAQQIQYSIDRIHTTLPRLYLLAIGGTAVGTGIFYLAWLWKNIMKI